MKTEGTVETGTGLSASERREGRARKIIGHLVALDGMHAVIACDVEGDGQGDYWSVGNLITIVHQQSRLIGVVCDLSTADHAWNPTAANKCLVKVELAGEIVDPEVGKPEFYRGIRSFPTLGSVAHRIRSDDLEAIYTVRGEAGVEIGRLTQNQAIPATVNIRELTSRHFALVGSTGVGKSTAVSMLLKQCIRTQPHLRIIIADPHNEYGRHFEKDAEMFDVDNLEIPYWMFRFDEIADIIFSGRKPHADELDALYEVIRAAKMRFMASNAGRLTETPGSIRRQAPAETLWISADTPVPYRVNDAIQIIDEWMGKLDPRYARADMRALRNRIDSLSHDQRYRFMFGRLIVEDNLSKVLSQLFRLPMGNHPVTIVQLAGLPNEVVNSVVSVLARLAFDVAAWSTGPYQVAFICEEAHRYIPSDSSQGFEPTRRAIGRIAKEGRKYGVSLGVVTQRPAELDPTVLSQCSTMFAMRLGNEKDKDIVGSASGVSKSGAISFLSSLADREAIAFGEAIATPMRMKFGDYRVFEADRAQWPPRPREDLIQARAELRMIIARLRGESQNEQS
jgi:hypothetical protein